jgi:spermidine synthase
LAVGSLLASTFLFFVPLALLAMVCPFFVRVLTVSVSGVGGNVGRLTAISTLGSFVGTVLIGYVLIPFLPNSITMYLTALVLVLMVVGYFLIWGRSAKTIVALALLLALAGGAGYVGVRQDRLHHPALVELYRRNSNFGLLQVLDFTNSERRVYVNDYLTQNTFDTKEKKSVSMFTYMLHGLAQAYSPDLKEVLCIGLGVGIVPMEFARDGVKVDVVEINPAVVPLGEKYFNLEPQKLHIIFGDGREFLNRCHQQYDAVIMDAFLGDSCPSHLMTREAFRAIRRVLRPTGVLVINTFADLEPDSDFFSSSLTKTLSDVFPSVRIHSRGGGRGNTLFVASSQTNLRILKPPDLSTVHRSSVDDVQAAFEGVRETDPRHGRVLTDDYNPVEFYDASNREFLRRQMALYFKKRS